MQTDTLQLACEESQMARTTFSGPVRSLAGFISAGVKNQVTLTAGQTLAVEPSHDYATGITVVGNAGKMNITGFDLAGGASTLTLPLVKDATPTDATDPNQNNNFGAVIKIFLGNTLANDLVISCQGDDKLTGTALTFSYTPLKLPTTLRVSTSCIAVSFPHTLLVSIRLLRTSTP